MNNNPCTHPKRGRHPDQIQVYLKLHLIILRCSRPLCSSQTTTPSHPSTTHVFTVDGLRPAQEQSETTRYPCPLQPNWLSVLRSCCLRTQQCAKRKNPVLETPAAFSNPRMPPPSPEGKRNNAESVLCCQAQRRAPAY